MDTRRPLWFEQLREACKQTDTQYFDLDISDIPCRLWMRTQEERLRANDRLFSLLRSLDDGERRLRLNEILRHLRVNDEQRHNKMLTWDAVRIMKASNIDFGGHTATHPFMSKLTPETAEWEVGHCKQRIEAELQEPVSVFAYPNGREEDFGSWNKDVLRRAGYRAAATTIWGLNDRSTDPMELRRGGPWESTAALFAYKLDWYQLVND
jgi:hypothetical protein